MEGDQGGSGGVPIAHINLQRSSVIKRPEFMLLHEPVHAQGMGFKCNKGVFADHRNNHVETSDHLIGEYTAEIKLNGHIYYSGDPKCPSLIDSVYLTPTSDNPYDPYTIVCLRQLGRYNHPRTMALVMKQNYTKRYYKNRFSTSCQWKKYLPNIFGNWLQAIVSLKELYKPNNQRRLQILHLFHGFHGMLFGVRDPLDCIHGRWARRRDKRTTKMVRRIPPKFNFWGMLSGGGLVI